MARQIINDLIGLAGIALLTVLLVWGSIQGLKGKASQALSRWQLIAALCTPRGMLPNPANPPTYLPMVNPTQGPTFGNVFGSPDGSLWAADLWRRNGQVMEPSSVLIFTVRGVNMPYVGVARKGQISIPPGSKGNALQLESIDFNDRFEIRAEDGRTALMLLDLGMMQWLLDCDQVSFEMAGDKVQALVKQQAEPVNRVSVIAVGSSFQVEPVELELLFEFCDGFLQRVPELLRTEYAASSTSQSIP